MSQLSTPSGDIASKPTAKSDMSAPWRSEAAQPNGDRPVSNHLPSAPIGTANAELRAINKIVKKAA